MNISGFRTALTGGSRPNQFRVRLTFPAVISDSTSAARSGEFLCEASQLPGSTLGVAQAMFRGRRIPLAGDRQFQPWSITVVNDVNFLMRNTFESWMHYINNVRDNTGVQDPHLYSTDMGIDQLDRNDNVIKSYQFRSAFPVVVDPINLNFGDNDSLERFNVTLEYVSWDSVNLT